MARVKKDYIPEVDERGYLVDLQDLKRSYQQTLNLWQKKRKDQEELLKEMKAADVDVSGIEEELALISGIISDLNYTITWLHTGKRPGNMRGIERRSVYQNTILVDPHVLQSYAKPYESRSSTTLTDEQKAKVEDALRTLSPLEKECFILVEGRGFTSGYVAEMMNLSKGTVDTVIKRAKDKFQRGWQSTLF